MFIHEAAGGVPCSKKLGNYTSERLLNTRELSLQPKPFRRARQKLRIRCIDVCRCDQYAVSVWQRDQFPEEMQKNLSTEG